MSSKKYVNHHYSLNYLSTDNTQDWDAKGLEKIAFYINAYVSFSLKWFCVP